MDGYGDDSRATAQQCSGSWIWYGAVRTAATVTTNFQVTKCRSTTAAATNSTATDATAARVTRTDIGRATAALRPAGVRLHSRDLTQASGFPQLDLVLFSSGARRRRSHLQGSSPSTLRTPRFLYSQLCARVTAAGHGRVLGAAALLCTLDSGSITVMQPVRCSNTE